MELLVLIITFAITKVKYEGIKSSININKILKLLIIIFIVIILLLNYNTKLYDVFIPIIGRMESFFDIKSHVRLFLIIMPFVWVTKESFLNLYFGYGPGSYKYLNLTEFLPTGDAVHKTSNNIFSDTVYETGYLGLIMYVVLFIKLIHTPFKNVYQNRDYFFATMFSVHLMLTSVYRADYMQIRFWILIFIIFKLMRFAKMKGLE